MRIGDFARKYDLNISTVRFYVNNGLILPKMVNGRYDFDGTCSRDMDRILRYKKYHFTLEEIQLLFFMEKASRFQDDTILEICGEILKNKKKELMGYRDELEGYIQSLDKELETLSVSPEPKKEGTGVPFSFIPDLYCPKCQVPLKLEEARLVHNSLERGVLWCDCGYKAHIQEGIIHLPDCTEETPFKAFENVESVMAMKEQFSASYRMLIGKAYLWMYTKGSSATAIPKHILIGPFTFNFLLEYLEKLNVDHTYILFDPSVKRMTKMKRYLSGSSHKIVYIAGGIDMLPLKHGSCDLYVDDYSTVNHLFTYGQYPGQKLAPLLKRNGSVVGIFTEYGQAPKSLANFKKMHPDFPVNQMKLSLLRQDWERSGVIMQEQKKIGVTSGSELHDYLGAPGEQVEVRAYLCKKVPKR